MAISRFVVCMIVAAALNTGAQGAGRGPAAGALAQRADGLTPIPGRYVAMDERGWRSVDRPALAGAGAFVSPVFRTASGGVAVATPTVFVAFEDGLTAGDRAALTADVGSIRESGWRGLAGVTRVEARTRSGLELLTRVGTLARRPGVRWAEVDMFVEISPASLDAPTDPRFGEQWTLENTGQSGGTAGMDVRALDAWAITPGDPSVLTVVLDVGVDQTHQDLNLIAGMDFTTEPGVDGGPGNACDNHGTWVAGRIAAIADNGLNVAGVAPGTRVASARIGISSLACNLTFGGQYSWTADAIMWADSLGARVTNNSNAYAQSSSLIREAYEATRDSGMVHFSSAGNDGSSGMTYPASLPTVMAIGAIDRTGGLSFFSNYGTGLALVAPGEEVVTTDRVGADGKDPGDDAIVDGTSFASPVAAGAAALLFSFDPLLTGADAEDILRASARDLGDPGRDSTFGSGLVDARAALGLAACWRSWSPGPTGPGPRSLAGMAYDGARHELVMFGGLNVFLANRETWVSDGSSWTLASSTGPSARYGHAMAYDPARGVVVLFGGFAGAAYSGETWEWDGAAWTLRAGAGPSGRLLSAMAYDGSLGGLVLFGGRGSSGVLGDTWLLNGSGWHQLAVSAPSARDGHAMATDPVSGRATLFGGSVGGDELWAMTDAGWELVDAGGAPGELERAVLVGDTHRDTLVLAGGQTPGGDREPSTWEWDGLGWTRRSMAGPGARSDAAGAFDPALGSTEIFGGLDDDGTKSDAWSWRIQPPTFTAQPSVTRGPSRLELAANAEGTGPLAYRWFRNGLPVQNGPRVTGAASPTLVIDPASRADFGVYWVEVTDLCGTAVSDPVTVVGAGRELGAVTRTSAGVR